MICLHNVDDDVFLYCSTLDQDEILFIIELLYLEDTIRQVYDTFHTDRLTYKVMLGC